MKVEDEETKNHKETDAPIVSGFMPEIPNCKMCPVQSFLTYLYSLSPNNDNLRQSPKFTEFPGNPHVCHWYGPGAVGHNQLDTFVSRMSQKSSLEDFKYTNHSLHVTTITALTKKQIFKQGDHGTNRS